MQNLDVKIILTLFCS